MEEGLFRLSGAPEPAPDKFVSLATLKFIGGLQTQRSAFASIDNRYSTKFLGGKPDALIDGVNCEINNKLLLQRRPGLTAYGTANIPAPTNYFDWQLATTGDINLVIDTESAGGDNVAGAYGAVFRYSTTNSGIYINKAINSKQTNFYDIVNTMYLGDGQDLFKVTGPNLLQYSNLFGTGAGTNFSTQAPWTDNQVFALTGAQTDPLGGTAATQIIWNTTGTSANIQQTPTLNYTPLAKNTFTFSVWLRVSSQAGTPSLTLYINDQSGTVNSAAFNLTQTWTKYQVTATMNSGSTSITVEVGNPNTAGVNYYIYGTQLEVGGPATTTQITTNKAQGVYRWGIQAPTAAPTALAAATSVGAAWSPSHAYSTAIYKLTQATANTPSGGHTRYTGTFPNGASNNLSGQYFQIAGFANANNNGTLICTASTATTIDLTNTSGGTNETHAGTATPAMLISSVTAAVGTATYNGTIFGGGGNAWAGYAVTIVNFANAGNNGTFFIQSSTGTSLTVINTNPTTETPAVQAYGYVIGQAITDSNGNMEVATASGTSGGSQPVWSQTTGGVTQDGTNNVNPVQYNSGLASAVASVSVAFGSNNTAGNTLLAFVAANGVPNATHTVTDSASNGWTQVAKIYSGPFGISVWWVNSCAAGANTVTASQNLGGVGIWLGIVEMPSLASVDGFATNYAASVPSGAGSFTTGAVSTTTTHDFFTSFCMIVAGNQNQNTTLTAPPSFTGIITATDQQVPQGYMWIEAAFQYVTSAQSINPNWTRSFAAGGSRECGITVAWVANNNIALAWTNYGAIGLTAAIGFQYYYAFMNSYTGHVSNVSPISSSTGVLAGASITVTGQGMQITPSGPYNADPQVDTIALFRNTDGGGFWYQLATFANPGTTTSPGTWTYTDTTPSSQLNTSLFAPIGLLNSLPPAGLVNMEYFAGRMWGSVNNFLYYNTAADNASLLNVAQNGVASESWEPTNYIPFNSPIVRSLAVGNGLIVFTTTDTWLVTGQNLLTGGFNPTKSLANHGLRSYNAACLDGNTLYMYTSDRQCLQISPNGGSVEVGFPIGDLLENNFSPLNAFFVRHVAGSQDNAVYLADGSTGWYRLNPNQQGASMSGEATPLWSPKGDFSASIGGIGAIASIEVSAGVIKLLVGQNSVGPLLQRSLTTFTDNGFAYQWTATIGSILLATPGKLAEIESITTEQNNLLNASSLCDVLVLIDEIGGNFEQLATGVYDPPQLVPVPSNSTVRSTRYYLMQGSVTPVGRNMQIELRGQTNSGLPVSTKDELLSLTIRGCLVPEQV